MNDEQIIALYQGRDETAIRQTSEWYGSRTALVFIRDHRRYEFSFRSADSPGNAFVYPAQMLG